LESRTLMAAIAGDLLVDVDARALSAGAANAVPNNGTLGGVFAPTGGDATTVPVIGRPDATATSGTQGIRFDGTDFLQLVNAADSSLITAPDAITGLDPNTSIETWVWNPGIPSEETMVAWGYRNGPEGSNMSFNYGNNPDFGAVGHWGTPDIGWGPTVPAAGQWHHLVYTFDGDAGNGPGITRVYIDGALANTEDLPTGALNIHIGSAINLATQLEPNGTATVPLRGNLTLGKVRIHTGVLSDAQVLANYNEEKPQFVEPVIPPPPADPAVLLVNVDATNLPAGAITSVANSGPLGGVFEVGSGTDPVIGTPLEASTVGTRGIRLSGDDYLQLVSSEGGALITAPAGITGVATSSIETWVWNPGIPDEETMVAWGKRGGPEGSNMSFNYGRHNDWGAMGHWGSQDAGWGGPEKVPAARKWHHLAHTWDSTTTRVYVDGQMVYSEVLGPGALNIHAGTPVLLGAQLEGNGVDVTVPLRGSLTLGKVRIYDGVLTDAQITTNFNNERAQFVEPVFTAPPAVKLVDVDATGLPLGSTAPIANTGSLGGFFEGTGGGDTVPVIAPPLTSVATGTRGIRLDGTDYLQLVAEPGMGNLILAPESITGLDAASSVETWVFNPSIPDEETMVSWGKRGGPVGSNMSFNYGDHNDWGAVGKWGAQDIGWGPAVPPAGTWHHLVHTFDGATTRIYVDGQLANSEVLGEGATNVHPDTAITLGAQLDPDGSTVTQGLRGSLTLGKVRIYEGVLTDAQIAANYTNERAGFVNPTVTPISLVTGPVHRYTFNDAAGTTVTDSVGTAHGAVLGAGATFNGSRLVLPGGPSDTAAYVDLPNGLLSSLGAANGGTGQVTFEGWVRHTGSQSWSRFYDFGTGTAGELTAPGGGPANGVDFFMLTAQTGGDTTAHRYEATDNSDGDPTGNRFEDAFSNTFNTDLHFAVTWNEVAGELKYFENGREVGAFTSPVLISAIDDVNNWLGRSNFTADANLQAEFDEFRIYNRALSAGEVVGNFQAGANVLTSNSPQITAVYARGSTWLGNDNDPNNVTFMEFMQSSGAGHVLYGYPLSAAPTNLDTVSWINTNEIVIRYAGPAGGAPTAGTITVDGTRQDYTVTQVIPLDDRTFALRLDRPLGNIPGGGIEGDRVRLTVPGAGPGGGNFTQVINVLQGDANREANGRVTSNDQGYVKSRLNRSTNAPTSATGGASYSVFADVDASGRVNSNDQGAVKSRLNDNMPVMAPVAAGVFGTTSITKDILSA
jgi:hypothetical protein